MFRKHKTTSPTRSGITTTGGTHADKERFMSAQQDPNPIRSDYYSGGTESLRIGEQAGQYSGSAGVCSYTSAPVSSYSSLSSCSSSSTRTETMPAIVAPVSTSSSPALCSVCGKQPVEIAPVTSEHSAIVKEIVVPTERYEVTPEIFREREKQQVKFVIQPITEKFIEPILTESRVEPCITRDCVTESRIAVDRELNLLREREKASTLTRPCMTERVELPAIIHETVTNRFVQEVQPIVEREVKKATIIKVIKPIHEKIIETPILVQEVRPTIIREPLSGLSASPAILPQKMHHHKEPTYVHVK